MSKFRKFLNGMISLLHFQRTGKEEKKWFYFIYLFTTNREYEYAVRKTSHFRKTLHSARYMHGEVCKLIL